MKQIGRWNIELLVRTWTFIFLLAACCLLSPTNERCRADVTVSSGEFVDSSGAPHPWHVNLQHALIWGGRPWMPAGGLFQSRYLCGPQTDANWNSDVADLQTLKAHGVHSLVLEATAGLDPITNLPPETLQKFLAYLDQNGFQYGLTLASFPRRPVEATIVNPAVYRVASPSPGSVTYFRNIQALTGATYYLVSESDGSIVASGSAKVVDDQSASVTLGQGQGGIGTVLLLYPKRLFLPGTLEGDHLPDIWGQSDDYRDSLLLFFSRIKFGSGLRFFLDPVLPGLNYSGDADAGAIPDGTAYQFQFQMWLQTRYGKSLPRLNSAWGVKNQDVFDFAAASRCLPLWYQSKGIQLFVDPASNKTFEVVAADSHFWEDVRLFRADSMRAEMNGLSIAIKNGLADVPVVYRWTRPSDLYVDNSNVDGYDGLMVSSDEHGDQLARDSAGWALAETEQSCRTMWLLGELAPTQTGGANGSRDQLTGDSAVLQSLAVKGYFVNALRRLAGGDSEGFSLLDGPAAQLDWLHDDETAMAGQGDTLADLVPDILYFPLNLHQQGAQITQFEDGTWWLPSYRAGVSIDIGRGLNCYSLVQPSTGNAVVLWSPDGSVTSAQFKLPKKSLVSSTTPGGKIVTISLNKDIYTFATSKIPLVVHGVETLPLVANATILELAQAQRLIDEGTSEHIPMDVDEQRLYYIKNQVLDPNDDVHQRIAYPLVAALNSDMEREMDPNAWAEGEAASQQTFGTVVSSAEASGGAYLWQDTPNGPIDANPYTATYTLNVGAPGDYTVWASIAPDAPGSGAASPLSYSLDSGTEYDVTQPEPSGAAYGTVVDAATMTRTGRFRWYRLGALTLTSGIHALNFYITGPAPSTNRYTLGIDAICLSRGTFLPDGPNRPVVH